MECEPTLHPGVIDELWDNGIIQAVFVVGGVILAVVIIWLFLDPGLMLTRVEKAQIKIAEMHIRQGSL